MDNNPFVGVWRLVTFEFWKEDGSIIYPFGAEAHGSFIYTKSGHFSVQLMRPDRPKFAVSDQQRGTPDEIKTNYTGAISYYGTYKVDLENQMIVHHVEGSIFPNMEGTDQIRSFEVSKKRLQLDTTPFNLAGERGFGKLLWERIE